MTELMNGWSGWEWSAGAWGGLAVFGALAAVALYDLLISKDNILRNFPVIGHLRYLLIEIGPELRQYIVANNREEAPFNREEREWIYRSADGGNNLFAFGTDDQIYGTGYPIIKHAAFPYKPDKKDNTDYEKKQNQIPCAKILGEFHGRKKAWRPTSIVNISAMSFGALSARAIEAMNLGARQANCFHNSGEGGISSYHRNGADVVFQIGTGYFGCRDENGNFSLEALQKSLATYPKIRAIELKLSQGAKPGKGGLLPGRKVTKEIAKARGVAVGQDCISPSSHGAFHDVKTLVQFIERIAAATGLPVGIKSAVGHLEFWQDLAQEMRATRQGPDFIAIDGGEGGTGAAPLTFADHVSLPFKIGFTRVFQEFQKLGISERVVWIGSGKLGFPDRAIVAFALGVDMIAIAREAMLSIGCIQAQKCHTGHCPAGIATQSAYLQRAVDPVHQAIRFQRFCESLRSEILAVTHSCGYEHPSQFTMRDIEVGAGPAQFTTLQEIHGYEVKREWKPIPGWKDGSFIEIENPDRSQLPEAA